MIPWYNVIRVTRSSPILTSHRLFGVCPLVPVPLRWRAGGGFKNADGPVENIVGNVTFLTPATVPE
jgi:hypothetical protein